MCYDYSFSRKNGKNNHLLRVVLSSNITKEQLKIQPLIKCNAKGVRDCEYF